MSLEKEMKLFRLLRTKTDAGTLAWKETVNPGVFRVNFSDSSVELSVSERNGTTDVFMFIRDDEGNIVSSVSDVDFAEESGNDEGHWYTAMKSLYDNARKSVLGTDKILNSIIAELEGDIPF